MQYLGAAVCKGDMQRVREDAKRKNPAGKLKIMGQQIELHTFYNALQASGGAVDAVKGATRLATWAIQSSYIRLLSRRS
jgi:hypothetical protein